MSPACSIRSTASAWLRPTTFGTATPPAAGLLPVETLIPTIDPFGALVPGGGAWETTIPFGCVDRDLRHAHAEPEPAQRRGGGRLGQAPERRDRGDARPLRDRQHHRRVPLHLTAAGGRLADDTTLRLGGGDLDGSTLQAGGLEPHEGLVDGQSDDVRHVHRRGAACDDDRHLAPAVELGSRRRALGEHRSKPRPAAHASPNDRRVAPLRELLRRGCRAQADDVGHLGVRRRASVVPGQEVRGRDPGDDESEQQHEPRPDERPPRRRRDDLLLHVLAPGRRRSSGLLGHLSPAASKHQEGHASCAPSLILGC